MYKTEWELGKNIIGGISISCFIFYLMIALLGNPNSEEDYITLLNIAFLYGFFLQMIKTRPFLIWLLVIIVYYWWWNWEGFFFLIFPTSIFALSGNLILIPFWLLLMRYVSPIVHFVWVPKWFIALSFIAFSGFFFAEKINKSGLIENFILYLKTFFRNR